MQDGHYCTHAPNIVRDTHYCTPALLCETDTIALPHFCVRQTLLHSRTFVWDRHYCTHALLCETDTIARTHFCVRQTLLHARTFMWRHLHAHTFMWGHYCTHARISRSQWRQLYFVLFWVHLNIKFKETFKLHISNIRNLKLQPQVE